MADIGPKPTPTGATFPERRRSRLWIVAIAVSALLVIVAGVVIARRGRRLVDIYLAP